MSDYNKTTNFAAKDTLPTGDPGKVIKGSDFDTEFTNIQSASATKADKVTSAVNENLLMMNAAGNLVDTGVPKSRIDIVPVANGGTGGTTASSARSNLGLGGLATLSSVAAAQITDGSVGTAELANGAVTSAKIAAGSVRTTELADNAVTTGKIASGAVTTSDIATRAVTSAKIGFSGSTMGSWTLTPAETVTIPEGFYYAARRGAAGEWVAEMYVPATSAWVAVDLHWSDGSNFRIRNTSDLDNVTIDYRKLA